MTGAGEWQGRVGQAWADEWRRTDRSFAALTPHLLAAIAAEPGDRVLDIGCGAGELSLALAHARPAAQITGFDISADLVATASQRAAERGTRNVRFRHADAADFKDAHGPADLLVSRHGVMFFADPPAVFRHLADRAAPGARLVFSCFRGRSLNPWADLLDAVSSPAMPLPDGEFPPGPFAFADPGHVERCLAGWTDLTFTPVDFAYVAGAGDEPVADAIAFFSRIGPVASRLAAGDGMARAELLRELALILESHCVQGQVVLPAAAWIVGARLAQ